MEILVTGASGMLAADIVPWLFKANHKVIQTDIKPRTREIEKMDVTKVDDIYRRIEASRPDYVFHLAAETDVDLCEKNPDHAFMVNTLATENIALACQEFNIRLLYISTAGVFSGDKLLPYNEFDVPNPINIYAKSKFQGELVVSGLLSRYFIVRAGWMVGGWELDKKFVYKIVQQVQDGKKELFVVNDKFGSPTFTMDFARNIMKIINTGRYGIYHMANKGTCSRYDMAVKILEFLGIQNEVKINPINSAQFPLPAPRGRSEMLENYKLELLGINDMPHWKESLKVYIKTNI